MNSSVDDSSINIQYIKLGEKGSYENECLKTNSTIKLGYNKIDHALCMAGDWGKVSLNIANIYGTGKIATTSHKNQLKKFYDEPETTMWITFSEGKLFYCFANKNVILNTDGTRERKTLGGWKQTDSNGNTLFIQFLSGRLTQVQGFRGTICDVKEKKYLINKIFNRQSKELAKVERDLQELRLSIEALIKNLNHKDFEVFVDLIFRSAGWSRTGALGKTIKTIDIELLSPVTNEKAAVQVKSKSNLKTFKDYEQRLSSLSGYDHLYYVTHSPDTKLQQYVATNSSPDISFWDAKKLAELSINAGLLEWLVNAAP